MGYASRPRIWLALLGVMLSAAPSALSQETAQGRTVSVNDIQMYYEVYGDGPPLVLLHGFTGSSQGWTPYVEGLGKEFQLIVPDLRGHGRSTNPSNEFTHRQAALDVFALLDQLQIDRFSAIGGSTGGMTLLHMATQQPERVEALVLIGATSYFPEQARAIMRRASADSLTPEQWERYRQRHHHGDEQIRGLLTQFNAFKDNYDDMNFTPPYLATIRARTLIVHGDRDRFFPVSIPVEMYGSIPNAYLWIVPNGGHGPIAANDAFMNIVVPFLQGAWEN